MSPSVTIIVVLGCLCVCWSLPTRIYFEKCAYKGFTCPASTIFPSKYDVIFECNNVTTQDVQFYLWQFNSLATIASLTIQKCERVQISFSCTIENKQIQWLKIKDVGELEIMPTIVIAANAPDTYLENITYMDRIYGNTFSQIKNVPNKFSCFVPGNDTRIVDFKNVNIGTVHTNAFNNLESMKTFSWSNVTVNRVETRAINMTFDQGGRAELRDCNLPVLEPHAISIKSDSLSVIRGSFGDIWTSGINGTIYDFEFSNNSVNKIVSGAFSVLSQNVNIVNNRFGKVESGAFRKISPGLLHDSNRSFDNLKFVYHFKNNVLGQVEDGSFRPDITSYKNVNANMCVTYNTVPCSCEGLAWIHNDVNFGPQYAIIKEFNNIVLDPEHSNICSFTPCTCFGRGVTNEKKYTSSSANKMITFLNK